MISGRCVGSARDKRELSRGKRGDRKFPVPVAHSARNHGPRVVWPAVDVHLGFLQESPEALNPAPSGPAFADMRNRRPRTRPTTPRVPKSMAGTTMATTTTVSLILLAPRG